MIEPFLDLLHSRLAALVIAVALALLALLLAFQRRGSQRRKRGRAAPPSARPVRPARPSARAAPAARVPVPVPRLAPARVPAPPPAAVRKASEPGPAAVLVVDDSAVARAKLRKLFEGAGYLVTVAGDGLQALEALATGKRFSVIVTDVEMPNMNGVELIKAVHARLETEDLPIIAITGHDEMHSRAHEVAGLCGLFKKPWNDRELLERVAALAELRAPVA